MELDIRKVLQNLLRFWWIIVLLGFIGASSGYLITKICVTPLYTANATMYVWSDDRGNQSYIDGSATSSGQISSSRVLATTYIYILQSRSVAAKVAEQLNLGYNATEIQSMMTVGTVNETEIIQVQATSESPEEAAAIANAVVEYGAPAIIEIVKAGSVNVVDYAKVPTSPSYPAPMRSALIYGAAAAGLSAAVIALIAILDNKVKSIEDIISLNEEGEDIPIIAVIPKLNMTSTSYRKYYSSSYKRYAETADEYSNSGTKEE